MTQLPDWSDDPGTRGTVRLRCTEPFDECGWYGTSRMVTQYGTSTWELDECPECGGHLTEAE